jgi:hypothetical protein
LSYEFDYRVLSGRYGIKYIFTEANTHRSRTAPYPRGADLRNGSHQEGWREYTCKNNIKVKPEQLKLSKTDPST